MSAELELAAADISSSPAGPWRQLAGEEESQLFWRLRSIMLRRLVVRTLARSRLRITLVAVLSVVFWGGLFALFWEAFRFLLSAYAQTVEQLLNLFFLSLLVMLTLSTGVILYSGLYRSTETTFLLTTPLRPERIFLFKLQEATWFSGWGFILMGTPMLVAYGVVAHAPWYYFAFLPAFVAAFICVPAAVGAIVCLLLVRWLPRARLRWVIVALAILAALTAGRLWSLATQGENELSAHWQDVTARLEFVQQRWLPSWWLCSGLLEASRPADSGLAGYQPWAQSILFLALMVANAMFAHLLAVWLARRMFRSSYSHFQGGGAVRQRIGGFWLDRLASLATWPLPQSMRLLIAKDLRLFRRDPVQWSQFVIFFGLLALYFFNIRRFNTDTRLPEWGLNLIGFLNVAVVGLILSTFTTRFIFPLISLEGRRFWILSRLPVRRETILWSKFVFACAGSLLPCAALILISDLMLQISTPIVLMHQLTCGLLCVGLSGIAVGLGARLPELRESSPSKIAASFGGTLNLVLSAAFILVLSAVTALPSYLYLHQRESPEAPWPWPIDGRAALALGIVAAIAIGTLTAAIPLRLGMRAFRKMEF